MIQKTIVVFIMVAGFVFTGLLLAAEAVKTKSAVDSAEYWMALLDGGQYGECWMKSDSFLKRFIEEKKWVELLETIREPLGGMITRKVGSTLSHDPLDGLPEGESIVIEFSTSLENYRNAVETVVIMLGKDGQWRVAGYCIR